MEKQKERLQILRDGGLIDETIVQKMNVLLSSLAEKGLLHQEDRVSMLVTHVAMALSRLAKGEAIDQVDENLQEEVESSPNFSQALALWDELVCVLGELPLAEKYYVLANFCNIIQKQ
ncbi:MAG: hypothetical protein ACRCY4_07970 [Brevinema sp.]